ncbi:hypothetical protein J6590_107600 [Homalodisca vitripennis]|nr:hypothetical protein J6590_107600 [Homalodisca vitripennis]
MWTWCCYPLKIWKYKTPCGHGVVCAIVVGCETILLLKAENCEKENDNKQSDHNIEDSWLSEPKFDNSDLDKDYVPNSEPSTSDDEYSRPSTSREEAINQKAKSKKSEEIIPDFLPNDLYLSSEDETNFYTTISSKESIGMLYLKSSFDSDFSTVNLNMQLRKSARSEEEKFPVNLPVKTPVLISQQKYNDLMSLLPFVPSICHDFYKNLVKGNDKTQDYPVSDESDGEG